MIKILEKIGLERAYLHIVRTMYEKPTANIILNGENMNTKGFCRGKENTNWVNRKATEQKRNLTDYSSERGLISKIKKERK